MTPDTLEAVSAPAPETSTSGRSEAILGVEGEMTKVLRAVRTIVHRNAGLFSEELQPSGYLVLGHIAKHHPTAPGDIVARMGIDKSALSRQLRTLKELGFVTSEADPADGRSSLFSPTEETVRRLAEIRERTHTVYEELFAEWSDGDLSEFVRLLGMFTEGLERR
ncbi:MarR family transcriptional regulator [Herbiconiux moechotypicola]|uniref:MarR family transcriptional regulator n=1 Tax=Herbiconiux moechotypicola TaxID=637393 RepID=A0ABN3E775_9MICO|nr:MarR family transcriptional regulator [Herbiconiux moechotypicola]MCS5731872.1 MarR family transcriptional regulator [Herbiconiux moechotypicola]